MLRTNRVGKGQIAVEGGPRNFECLADLLDADIVFFMHGFGCFYAGIIRAYRLASSLSAARSGSGEACACSLLNESALKLS